MADRHRQAIPLPGDCLYKIALSECAPQLLDALIDGVRRDGHSAPRHLLDFGLRDDLPAHEASS